MRITLIKPTIGRLEHSLFVDEARMEPLQLGLLAALGPGQHVVCVPRDDEVPAQYTRLARWTIADGALASGAG